ncbi:MAG: GNAT family N-acetyltransferase [Roseburia sp.]|nr:GNAT family N-acetyltransferase [Roseburia sp.]
MYIKTERLELKPLSDSDRDNMIEILTNNEIKKTYMLPDFETEEQAEKLFVRLKEGSQVDKVYQVGIFLNGEVIGFSNEVDRAGDKIELGYMLHPKHHNKGYGTEMLKAMIEEMFARGFSEVIAGAFEENPASMRVMEKSGMTKLDKTDEIEYRGVVHKCLYYSKKRA